MEEKCFNAIKYSKELQKAMLSETRSLAEEFARKDAEIQQL